MNYFEYLSLLVMTLGVVATAVVSTLLFRQNRKLQMTQEYLQSKQIAIEERPYIEKIYNTLYHVYNNLASLSFLLQAFQVESNAQKMGSVMDMFKNIGDGKFISEEITQACLVLSVGKNYVCTDIAAELDAIEKSLLRIQVLMTICATNEFEGGVSIEEITELMSLCAQILQTKDLVNASLKQSLRK